MPPRRSRESLVKPQTGVQAIPMSRDITKCPRTDDISSSAQLADDELVQVEYGRRELTMA